MRTIKVLQCDHCGFYKKSKRTVKNHEQRCYNNHETRSCQTCVFLFGDCKTKCYAGIKFDGGKLKTQCDKHIIHPGDFDEALRFLEIQGVITIIKP